MEGHLWDFTDGLIVFGKNVGKSRNGREKADLPTRKHDRLGFFLREKKILRPENVLPRTSEYLTRAGRSKTREAAVVSMRSLMKGSGTLVQVSAAPSAGSPTESLLHEIGFTYRQ